MARFTFKLPDIGEGISEAEIVAWHVRVGDRIEEDQQIADMMTDKATVEMESPVSGIVVELAGEVGDQVSIGAALVVIETDGDFSAEEAPVLGPVTTELKAAPPSAEQVEVAEQYGAENPGVGEVVEKPSPPRGESLGEGPPSSGAVPVAAPHPNPLPQGRGRGRSSPPPLSAPVRPISESTLPTSKPMPTASAMPIWTRIFAISPPRATTPRTPAAPAQTSRSRSSACAARSPRICRRRNAISRTSPMSTKST